MSIPSGVNSASIDGNTIALGAASAVQSFGTVFIYVRGASAWTEQAVLNASNAGAGDLFGRSVSLVGDALLVGAPSEDSNATGVGGQQSNNSVFGAGAAYLFRRTANAWAQTAYIKSQTAPAQFDDFGWSVALSPTTLVCGATGAGPTTTGNALVMAVP
jgi:hypothetical protein